jgi:hypothetical protein
MHLIEPTRFRTAGLCSLLFQTNGEEAMGQAFDGYWVQPEQCVQPGILA